MKNYSLFIKFNLILFLFIYLFLSLNNYAYSLSSLEIDKIKKQVAIEALEVLSESGTFDMNKFGEMVNSDDIILDGNGMWQLKEIVDAEKKKLKNIEYVKYYYQKKLSETISICKDKLKNDRDNADLYIYIIDSYIQLNNFNDAIKWIDIAKRRNITDKRLKFIREGIERSSKKWITQQKGYKRQQTERIIKVGKDEEDWDSVLKESKKYFKQYPLKDFGYKYISLAYLKCYVSV